MNDIARYKSLATVISALLVIAACKESAAPEQKASPLLPLVTAQPVKSNPPRAPEAPPTQPNQGSELKIKWTTPAGWSGGISDSPMQKARYSVPPAAKDTTGAVVTVFYFGPDQGGTVDANIERWINQFSDVKKETVVRNERNVNDLHQHLVEIPKGSYASGMPGAPAQANKDYALMGAIVEAASGKYFFKMLGPKDTVAARKAELIQLLDSVKQIP